MKYNVIIHYLFIVFNDLSVNPLHYDPHRALRIARKNGSFGFVIKGSNPAYIETVDENGAAEKSGFQPGDFIMKLNGIDVRYVNFFFCHFEVQFCTHQKNC